MAAHFLSTDAAEAMTLAVGYLTQLGHTRIGLATGPARSSPSARERVGFVAALRNALDLSSKEATSWIEDGLFTVEGGATAADSHFDRGA